MCPPGEGPFRSAGEGGLVSVAAEQGEPRGSRHGAGVLLPASPSRPGFVARALQVPCSSERGTAAILVQL